MLNEIWEMNEYYDMFRYVVFIGDTHVGHENFWEAGLKKLIRKISRSKSYRVVIMGDLFEMATKNKMRSEQELNTGKQLNKFLSLFDPIRERVIAVLQGNHDKRIAVVDYVRDAVMPHFPNAVYLGYEGFLKVGNDKFPPTIMYLHHGKGGSKRPDYFITNRIFKMGVQCVANLIAVGHLHVLWDDTYWLPVEKNGKVVLRPLLMCRTGHWLKTAQYAREAGHRITKMGAYRYDLNKRELELM